VALSWAPYNRSQTFLRSSSQSDNSWPVIVTTFRMCLFFCLLCSLLFIQHSVFCVLLSFYSKIAQSFLCNNVEKSLAIPLLITAHSFYRLGWLKSMNFTRTRTGPLVPASWRWPSANQVINLLGTPTQHFHLIVLNGP